MTERNSPADPLAGARILEISTRVAGGYAGKLLHDLGASVTRVDLPLVADVSPEALPELVAALHRGKATVAPTRIASLDFDLVLADSRRDDALDGFARRTTADILAALPQDLPIVDLAAYRSTRESHPVDAEVPHEPATSVTVCATAGMSWAIGAPDRQPLPLPYDVAETMSGTEAAAAAALALIGRCSGAETSRVWDISGADLIANYVGQICSNFLPYERPWRRDGARASMSGGSYPAAMFPCADGYIGVMCRIPKEWDGLLAAMGNPEWSRDPRFADAREVARHYADEADAHLLEWLGSLTCKQVFDLGKEFGFPVAPINTIGETLALEQFHERGFVTADVSGRPVLGKPWRIGERLTESAPRPQSTRRAWNGDLGTPDQPLRGLRVLDLSWVWAGPMVTAALGDLGAEIIKIEGPTRPDPSRLRGRAIRNGVPVDGPEYEVTPYFNQMNRGKNSVGIDITTPEGRELVLGLAGECDVVVENMRPGALDRRGLGYAELSARNPSIVMLSMSLMGQTGPMRGLGGYAAVMSGIAGLDSLVGYDENNLIGLYNPALGDPNGAGHGLATLLAALYRLRRTGHGAWIDLAQVEALVAVQCCAVAELRSHGKVRVPADRHAVFSPHGTWRAAGRDEWVAVAIRTDTERRRLAELIGSASADASDLRSRLEAWIAERSAAEAEQVLRAAGLAAAEVQQFEGMVECEWGVERQIVGTATHPYLGDQLMFPHPWKHDGFALTSHDPAPLLGSSTDAVLTDILGLDEAQITRLRTDGAIA